MLYIDYNSLVILLHGVCSNVIVTVISIYIPVVSIISDCSGYILLQAKIVKTGQLSALKIIKIEAGEDLNIIQQEIAILGDCKHDNIVGYYGSYLRYVSPLSW